MCLAVPTRVKAIEGDRAIGEVGGVEREISIVMTPGVKVGDYVIVHAGFAIQILDRQAAEESLAIFTKMAERVEEFKKGVVNRPVQSPPRRPPPAAERSGR